MISHYVRRPIRKLFLLIEEIFFKLLEILILAIQNLTFKKMKNAAFLYSYRHIANISGLKTFVGCSFLIFQDAKKVKPWLRISLNFFFNFLFVQIWQKKVACVCDDNWWNFMHCL